MKTLKVITSTEYHANQPSVFTMVNDKYIGCLIYPRDRNYPTIEYWTSATSSDSDRGFFVEEKQFSDSEIEKIIDLQNAYDLLCKLIPEQPNFPHPTYEESGSFKIRRGKNWENYKAKKENCQKEIAEYFASIKIYNAAQSKAYSDLRNILTKQEKYEL
jgi:hypothetical protein